MKTTNEIKGMPRSAFIRTLALAAPLFPGITALAAAEDETPAKNDGKPDLGNLRAFVELARADVRTQKSVIVAQNLPLTDSEAESFWPMHREYDLEYTKLLDERYAAIIKFAEQYGSMTNAQATDSAKRSFDLESKRTELKKKYFSKFSSVVPATKAARFFQIENQLNMVLDLQVAASLPLIE